MILPIANRSTLLAWTQVLVFASVLLAILSPFAAPLLAIGTVAVQAFWIARDHGDVVHQLRTSTISRSWFALFAFVGYEAIRLYPESNINAAIGVIAMAGFALSAFGAFALFPRQNGDVQEAIARAILLGFGVGSAILLFELFSGFAVRRWFWGVAPMFRPRLGKVAVDGTEVRVLVPYIANQSSAVLASLFWPVLLLHGLTAHPTWQRIAIGMSLSFATVAIFVSNQATSKAAFVAGLATWAIVSVSRSSVRPFLLACWFAATMLVLPAAWLAYNAEAYHLPPNFSARHRVVLWGVTAEKTFQHPIFGIGTGRTPDFDDSMRAEVKMIPGTNLPIATNRHAHNVFLQTWYEGGAVGAFLLMLAGLPIIGWISRAPNRAQPWLAAGFVASLAGASFSYSILAGWFLATFAVTAIFSRFALYATTTGDAEVA